MLNRIHLYRCLPLYYYSSLRLLIVILGQRSNALHVQCYKITSQTLLKYYGKVKFISTNE